MVGDSVFHFVKIIVVLVIRFFVFKNYDGGDSVFHFLKIAVVDVLIFRFLKKLFSEKINHFFHLFLDVRLLASGILHMGHTLRAGFPLHSSQIM